jgi:hypothetical protein
MRYRGGGVGHSTTRAATDFFKRDRHPRDQNRKQQQDEMDVDDVDQPQGDDDGVGQDEGLRSSCDPGGDMDEQDSDQGSDNEESENDNDGEEEEEESDEEGDGDKSETDSLDFLSSDSWAIQQDVPCTSNMLIRFPNSFFLFNTRIIVLPHFPLTRSKSWC